MELQKIIKDISNERFEPYLLSCNGDQKKAFELYEYNIKVSQSFYAPLSALEITLRNKIVENQLVLLLIGGDKSTQEKDIEKAKKIWDNYKNSNYNAKPQFDTILKVLRAIGGNIKMKPSI